MVSSAQHQTKRSWRHRLTGCIRGKTTASPSAPSPRAHLSPFPLNSLKLFRPLLLLLPPLAPSALVLSQVSALQPSERTNNTFPNIPPSPTMAGLKTIISLSFVGTLLPHQLLRSPDYLMPPEADWNAITGSSDRLPPRYSFFSPLRKLLPAPGCRHIYSSAAPGRHLCTML